jgi:hypothetical protein
MPDLPFDPIRVAAVCPIGRIRRRWQIAAHRDLFGYIIVETCWGRIGAAGQVLTRSFAEERQALAYVRGLLARRATAEKRIGAAYVSVA